MDLDQLNKRVQWIEEERRKERDAISILENRLLTLEGGIGAFNQQINDLSSAISRLAAVVTRMDQFDGMLVQQRGEAKQQVDELAKEVFRRADEAEKLRRIDVRNLEI